MARPLYMSRLSALGLLLSILAWSGARADLIAHFTFDGHLEDELGIEGKMIDSGLATIDDPVYVDGFDDTDEGALRFDGFSVVVINVEETAGVLPLTTKPEFSIAMIDELPCEDAADVDDSGVVDISDPIYNLTFQFVGGIAPPPAPSEKVCGPDPTGDERSCEAYPKEKC